MTAATRKVSPAGSIRLMLAPSHPLMQVAACETRLPLAEAAGQTGCAEVAAEWAEYMAA